MKRLTLTTMIICLAFFTSAQTSWQWGNIAGVNKATDFDGYDVEDDSRNLCTDPAGNSYALLYSRNGGGSTIYTGGDSSMTSAPAVLASWACDGHLRWMKSFSPSTMPLGLGADTLGGVYVTGRMTLDAAGTYVDHDTFINRDYPLDQTKYNFILKYDTSGKLKWLHTPDQATVIDIQTTANSPKLLQLNVSPNGELDILSYLTVGIHADGNYSANRDGLYILRYNSTGSFLQGIQLPVTLPKFGGYPNVSSIEFYHRFLRDPRNGRYYIGFSWADVPSRPAMYLGNDTLRCSGNLNSNMFVMSFDRTGSLKWLKRQTNDTAYLNDFILGTDGALYLSGRINNGNHWNGTALSAPGSARQLGFVVRMDSLGNNVWSSVAYDPLNPYNYFAPALAISRNNVLYAAGTIMGQLNWGTYHLAQQPPAGMSVPGICIARLNSSNGSCMGLDSLRIPKSNSGAENFIMPSYLACDRHDNLFISGVIKNSDLQTGILITINSSRLNSIGGKYDAFVAKYGVASCKAIPAPSSINNTTALSELKLYPNPTSSTVNISGIGSKLSYTLYNNMGSSILAGDLSNNRSTINVALLPAGFYYIQLRDEAGTKATFKIVKE